MHQYIQCFLPWFMHASKIISRLHCSLLLLIESFSSCHLSFISTESHLHNSIQFNSLVSILSFHSPLSHVNQFNAIPSVSCIAFFLHCIFFMSFHVISCNFAESVSCSFFFNFYVQFSSYILLKSYSWLMLLYFVLCHHIHSFSSRPFQSFVSTHSFQVIHSVSFVSLMCFS